MKRIGSLTLAALLGVAAWYAGSGLRVMQQQAFAQEIQEINASEGAYLLTYYDTSTAFGKSEGGYGGRGSFGRHRRRLGPYRERWQLRNRRVSYAWVFFAG